MPLPLPHLDDRRWQDLVEEGRALIPRLAPAWTDHNVHDPGITLIELFAWLCESAIYRLNQVPESHLRKFLALIGFPARPPQAAHAMISFTPEAETNPFLVPAGVVFTAGHNPDKPLPFRTLRPLTVSAVRLAALQVDAGDGKIIDFTRDWQAGFAVAALGPNPRTGASLYLGFSEIPVQVPVALAFNFQGPGQDLEERRRLIQEAAAQRQARRKILPAAACGGEPELMNLFSEMAPPHHSARIGWEALTQTNPETWTRLADVTGWDRPATGQVRDDSRSLTLDGLVEVNLPAAAKSSLGEVGGSLYYLRLRLIGGAYESPPGLMSLTPNCVMAEQAAPVTQVFTIPAGVIPTGPDPIPGQKICFAMTVDSEGRTSSLTFLEPPAPQAPESLVLDYQPPGATAPGHLTLELSRVGISDGTPEQKIILPDCPIQVKTLDLYTHTGEAWQAWSRQPDLDASTRRDCHFTLQADTGEISFGDGERGCVPEKGAQIFVAYRWTKAADGNVPPDVITELPETPHNNLLLAGLSDPLKSQFPNFTTNPGPATGGRGSESLEEAIRRAVETLHAHERLSDLGASAACQTLDQLDRGLVRELPPPSRAVNLLDLERLALEVPGTRIARARAWANYHEAYPCLAASGVVTLVIVPDSPVPRPEPSPGLLRAVKRYLDRRRTLCTRLEVVGPHYLVIGVRVRLRARPYSSKATLRTRVWEALDAFLDPRRGGPQGLGWPFGRDVYRSEILQVISGLTGVDHVLGLSFCAATEKVQCGNVKVCPTWLVSPGEHHIEVE